MKLYTYGQDSSTLTSGIREAGICEVFLDVRSLSKKLLTRATIQWQCRNHDDDCTQLTETFAIISYVPMMISRRILILLASSIISVAAVHAQYFPLSGRAAIRQRSLDVQARLNVLLIALRPGYEDLATLAYFRLGKGAQIASAFVTNAEGGESDVRGEYPSQIAAERRMEATEAIRLLDGGALFLNMPDIVAATDSSFVRSIWRTDTLRNRLVRMISDFQPDIILVARDWLGGTGSPQMQVVQAEILDVVRRLASVKAGLPVAGIGSVKPWRVARVLIDDELQSGARASVERIHPIWKKSYQQLGSEAAQKYSSISTQRRMWLADAFGEHAANSIIYYHQSYPQRKSALKLVDQDLPAPLPSTMTEAGKEIVALTSATIRGDSKTRDGAGKAEDVRVRLVRVMQSVDGILRHVFDLSLEERKIALQWKLTLEDLRLTLLGVVVQYTVDASVLTERQLAFLKIDTVTGIRPGGRSYLYFPTVDEKGWIINETPEKQRSLEFHKEYRLLTPEKLEYHLPAGVYGLQRTTGGGSFPFYVIHEGAKPEESFMARVEIPVKFAPRFIVEALTPVVSVVPDERLVLRLTNNTRDGVRDSIRVDDSLAMSSKRGFRLNTRGSTHLDTLILSWKQILGEGTYSIPVKIGGTTVAVFAARRFDVKVDATKRVALFSGIEGSPTADALRRLGVPWKNLRTAPALRYDLAEFQVVIVDRRALTLMPSLRSARSVFEQFVQRGGHLLVLAQDAGTWNANPLIDDLVLTPSGTSIAEMGIDADSSNRLLSTPNQIRREDWSNWLFQLSYNLVSGRSLENASIPVKTATEHSPLVIQWKRGAGTVTYADLAFHPQFLNVHAGAYRLLANFLSY
jgi:hypothetical protein